MQFLMSILEHPVLFVVLILCFMGFICMTYEFILRLSGRNGMGDGINLSSARRSDDNWSGQPPHWLDENRNANVGDAEIEGAEVIEDEDGNGTIEYIYGSDTDNYLTKWTEDNPEVGKETR